MEVIPYFSLIPGPAQEFLKRLARYLSQICQKIKFLFMKTKVTYLIAIVLTSYIVCVALIVAAA